MINRYVYKDTVWVDITNPTEAEVLAVTREFNVTAATAHELTSPSFKSRTELHRGYIYLILHFPAFRHVQGENARQEVDFIIGKNFLITARYETIDAMEKFSKIVEVNSILDRGFSEDATGALFFGMIQEIYGAIFNELEYIERWLLKIEEGIFAKKEKEMVLALSQVSRNLLDFKKSIDFHKEVLGSLSEYGKKIFSDEHFSYHIDKILDEYEKVDDALHNNMEFLAELRETNNSLLSTKVNEIMKTLTILASITFPLTIITGLFGMSVHIPFNDNPNEFWIILGGMILLSVVMFIFFKYKKWL